MTSRLWPRLMFFGWIAWAVVVLSHYYVQAFRVTAARQWPSPSDAFPAVVPFFLVGAAAAFFFARSRPIADDRPQSRRNLAPAVAALLGLAALATVPWALVHPSFDAAMRPLALPGFPWFGEAIGRGGAAVIGAALVAAAVLAAGEMVLRLIAGRAVAGTDRLIFAAASGIGVLSHGSLLLAAIGLFQPTIVAGFVALLLLAGASFTLGMQLRTPKLSGLATGRGASVWLALLATALAYGLVAALAPEIEFDALWYHLQLPRLWLEAGRPVDVIEEYVSLYPLTWELVFAAGMVLGGPVAAKLLHFACLPLLALLVANAVRRFVPGVSPVQAAAVLVATPTLLWEASTTYVDLALAFHAAAACYALGRHVEDGSRSWGVLAAVQLGLAAATKHLGAVIAVIALGIFVLALATRRKSGRWAWRRALLFAVIAAMVPAPWYMRNWLASGNPVFPEMFALFGASPPERWDAVADQGLAAFKAHFGRGRSFRHLVGLPWDVTVHGALFGGALGPLFLVLLPALAFGTRGRPALRWVGWGVVAYVAVWASPISSLQMRFLMPLVPALAIFAAAALSSLRTSAASLPYAPAATQIAIVGLAVLNLPPFMRLHEVDRVGWDGWLTHVLRGAPIGVVTGRRSQSEYLRRAVPSFAAWQTINEKLPAEVRILTFSSGDNLYARRPRIPHDATIARPAVWGAKAHEAAAAAQALRTLGITHVLFDRREIGRLNADSLAITSLAQQACISEYDDGRYWLCRIDYTRLSPQNRPFGGLAEPSS